jgi:hypothetical protein
MKEIIVLVLQQAILHIIYMTLYYRIMGSVWKTLMLTNLSFNEENLQILPETVNGIFS